MSKPTLFSGLVILAIIVPVALMLLSESKERRFKREYPYEHLFV